MLASLLWLIAIATVVVSPALILWGWVRYFTHRTPRTTASTLSLIGLSFSTASALLALSTHLYARVIHAFPYYHPALVRIYLCGCLLSSAGILFGVGGSAQRGPLRTIAPACASGTLLFWILAMSSE
jgi:hypothetical protein